MCHFPLKTNALRQLRQAIELERLSAPKKTLADLEAAAMKNFRPSKSLPTDHKAAAALEE